jgi:hypothetical protein
LGVGALLQAARISRPHSEAAVVFKSEVGMVNQKRCVNAKEIAQETHCRAVVAGA